MRTGGGSNGWDGGGGRWEGCRGRGGGGHEGRGGGGLEGLGEEWTGWDIGRIGWEKGKSGRKVRGGLRKGTKA